MFAYRRFMQRMLLKVQEMETPLEILSRAAQMVDNANAHLVKVNGQPRKVRAAVPRKYQRRNIAPVSAPAPQGQFQFEELDEPLDMSLKTRKRAASGDSVDSSNNSDGDSSIKKYRPSVISYGRMPEPNFLMESQTGYPYPMQTGFPFQKYRSIVMPRRRIQPTLVISEDYSEAGIDAHFERSLRKYKNLKKDEKGENLDNNKQDHVHTKSPVPVLQTADKATADEVLEIKLNPIDLKRKYNDEDQDSINMNKKAKVLELEKIDWDKKAERYFLKIVDAEEPEPVNVELQVKISKNATEAETTKPPKE